MLTKLTQSIIAPFSMRMKGPASFRAAQKLINNPADRNKKIQRIQDRFKDYYPQTNAFYKNGFEPSELQNANEMVKRAFSLENATPSQILAYRIQQAIKKYQTNLLDHGSSCVQFAIACQRIIFMMQHVKKYPHDTKGARALTKMIQHRKRMMAYCSKTDYHRYKWICIDYGVPDLHCGTRTHQHYWYKNNPSTGY